MTMVEISPELSASDTLPDTELHEQAGIIISKVESLIHGTHRIIVGITEDDHGTKVIRFGDREGKRVGELTYHYRPKTGLWECYDAVYFVGWNNDDPRGPRACTYRAQQGEKTVQLPSGTTERILTGRLDYLPSGEQGSFNTAQAARQINNALASSMRAFGLR